MVDLKTAEASALAQTCKRAELKDKQRILELGCGWGSLTLWMASHYPNSEITAVSNSKSQRKFLVNEIVKQGLSNVSVITADMNDFDARTLGQFDRVVSLEMFEHMRNWRVLFNRVSDWLKPDGVFFMHIFVHRSAPYFFEQVDDSDWMSRYFFSGGMMPSADLPLFFQDDMKLEHRWLWNGEHYAKTANAWLERMDRHQGKLRPLFEDTYGKDFASIWWMRWRMFFMACAELFAYKQGQEWLVGHYRFRNQGV